MLASTDSHDFARLCRAPLAALAVTLAAGPGIATGDEEPGGFIEIVSSTPGAAVMVDGIEVGRVPLRRPLEVAPGIYTVTLSAPGHMDHVEVVEIAAGRSARVEAHLLAFAGVLSLSTNVEGARARIGRNVFGETPLKEHEIVAGEHTIVVEAEGYLPGTVDVRVLAGERYDLSVVLIPDPEVVTPKPEEAVAGRLERRWILWAAAGAVAAGGGLALLASGGRSVEIFDPSRLPGGEPDAVINPRR